MANVETILGIKEYEGERFDGFEVTTSRQKIKLAIANGSCCCESWGYFWCNDEPKDFIGAKLLNVTETDTELNTKKLNDEGADSRDEGGIMFVNLVTDRGILQFVAYNSHNGYYGHTATVASEQLKLEESL